MIAFATFFLGLVVGVAPVTVLVEGPVASVRFELDGKTVGTLVKEPWTLSVDFGAQLAPHELVARSIGADGQEIGSARQFVNLPRPAAEVEVLLERDASGRAVGAHFSGSSLIASRPTRTTVIFDGKPLTADGDDRVKLPAHDGGARHVLSVELQFSQTLRSRTELVFGGGESGSSQSELTAVAVRRQAAGPTPEPKDLGSALLHRGQPLPVVAVESGQALVCLVRGPSRKIAARTLAPDGAPVYESATGRFYAGVAPGNPNEEASLSADSRVRFIWPVPKSVAAAPGAQLFDRSRDLTVADGGLRWMLSEGEYKTSSIGPTSLADATAAAGLEALASGDRRAVVLVLGDEWTDASRHSPESVRRYLEGLHIPLFVWSLLPPKNQRLAASWGRVEDVSSPENLGKAVENLKAALASQFVVWVRGRFMPQEILLSEKATGFSLPGSAP